MKPKRLSELVDVDDAGQRTREQLRIMDGLLAAAVRKGDFKAALDIMDRAEKMLRRRG